MDDAYRQSLDGLNSSDPETVLESAIWLVENPEAIEDQNCYMQACETLLTASLEDVECLRYIDSKLANEPIFKAQLLSQVIKDGKADEIKSAAADAVVVLIEELAPAKATSTEIVAQIYSYLEDTGNPAVLERAKLLL